ncbi:hypothetical protein [Roseivirga sp. E12]|uniref:hypothetical protein n=1 Tax=Roseivirga sp. E12 TaxID=2819237 RepID=UPI001ABD4607|nr:hypothetical protein [Roseivirga sp. E12]MBO3698076.1 hypothetical protein [Roseivirga sp. E12]
MSTSTIETKKGMGTSIAPSNKLENADGKAFILFGIDWLKLQSFITTCLQMPITKDDFTARYGSFSDESLIDDCIAAMKQIQALGTEMGSPTTLRHNIEKNPNYLSGDTPPKSVFAHCAWMAGRLSMHATTYNGNLGALKNFITNSPKENKKVLADIMSPTGGLQATAKRALSEIVALQNALSTFEANFVAAQKGIKKYVDSESKVIAAAKAAENVDTTTIASLQGKATAAHKAWENYTIGATTSSIGIAVISLGLLAPLGAVAGGVLGHLAVEELDAYNGFMKKIGNEQKALSQKTRLVLDLTSFDSMLSEVSSQLSKFKTDLYTIQGVWLSQNTQITAITKLPFSKIGSYSEIVQAIHLTVALKEWNAIATNTSEFITDSLVSYNDSVQYPAQYPTSS